MLGKKLTHPPTLPLALCGTPAHVAVQSASNLKCYSQISALGALGPGTWVLGSSFMHNVYSVFEYQTSSTPATGAAGSAAGPLASRGLKQQQAAGSAGPRVGLGELTAAEKAAAQAAFDRGLASKSSAGSSTGSTPMLVACLLLAVAL